jgi:hypothetical protein
MIRVSGGIRPGKIVLKTEVPEMTKSCSALWKSIVDSYIYVYFTWIWPLISGAQGKLPPLRAYSLYATLTAPAVRAIYTNIVL